MKKYITLSCFFAFVFYSSAILTRASDLSTEPPIQIERAIEKARDYIAVHKIDVSKSHIASAKLMPDDKRGDFWLITWVLDNKWAKGGQVFVKVFFDSVVEVTYGE